jgi:NAD(P)-dependent dehydrogenase (short-subunit alcohol dehydrogenase family)
MKKKVIIVTGASSGIGKATVIRLLKEGQIVIAAARRIQLMDDLKASGADVRYLDITVDETIVELVNHTVNKYGKIDALINNAGYGLYGAVADVPIEEAKKQFDVNLFGMAKITQLVLPVMEKQKNGTIINISSIGGKIYMPMGAWYHATKHAVEAFSDCLRMEVKSKGIKVVIIEPGMILSEWSAIAGNHMMEISGVGRYQQLANDFNKMLKSLYRKNKASVPDVIAKTIVKAMNAKRPKTRYIAGKMACVLLFTRKVLPDKVFDAIINVQIKYSLI